MGLMAPERTARRARAAARRADIALARAASRTAWAGRIGAFHVPGRPAGASRNRRWRIVTHATRFGVEVLTGRRRCRRRIAFLHSRLASCLRHGRSAGEDDGRERRAYQGPFGHGRALHAS